MKVLIAPNSMKGSLNAFDFADIVEKALLDCSDDFETMKIPVADGGDLTGEVLARNLKADCVEIVVHDPLGKKVMSKYFVAGKTAIIEMADASGMKLIDASELNPMQASSYGTGELIRHAIQNGCTEIFLAIGGSATVDGGLGMMRALGFILLDENDGELQGKGEDLARLKKIVPTEILDEVQIRIICDVDNPLLGDQGAAEVFGPQKGATPAMVHELESGLENLAGILLQQSGKDLKNIEGTGAAGGISLPLLAFGNTEIVAGANFVLKEVELEKWIRWADLVITGEGKLDKQTLNNKAPYAVARLARKSGKILVAIGGKTEPEASVIFDGMFSLVDGPVSQEYAIKNVKTLLYQTTRELARLINALNKS